MNYGLPYMGSKNGIAEWVIAQIPKMENFYDLFCGGCAITHSAMLTNKFRNIYFNDLNPFSQLFIDSIKGKYHNERRWINREEFENKKNTDPYIAMIWSFGNNLKDYMYSPENEKIKHALWEGIMNDNWTFADKLGIPFKHTKMKSLKNRRLDVMQDWKKNVVPKIKKGKFKFGNRDSELQSLESLERLERLQSLERLESLQSLERLESLQSLDKKRELIFTNKSYNEVEIKKNSIIYCDIPYRGTASYSTGNFNHEEFYKWAMEQNELVMISEYSMPLDRFICVAQKTKRNTLSKSSNKLSIEKIFVPKNKYGLYYELKK